MKLTVNSQQQLDTLMKAARTLNAHYSTAHSSREETYTIDVDLETQRDLEFTDLFRAFDAVNALTTLGLDFDLRMVTIPMHRAPKDAFTGMPVPQRIIVSVRERLTQ
jgi:hypothetical protein